MSQEISKIKDAAGTYQRWALEARKEYINLRLRQDPEIRGLYIRSANRVTKELRQLGLKTPSNYLRKRQLVELEAALRAEADRLKDGLEKTLGKYIEQAVGAGAGYSQTVTMDLLKKAGIGTPGLRSVFASVNRQAVEACWARTKKGLHLSDRIWKQKEKYRDAMRDIVQEAVATGQDAAKTARMLQQYVKQGKRSLAASYPKMMERMGNRIPGDVCYEALRLARTEMTAAFGEGSLSAAQASPSYIGMKYIMSASHPMYDICDIITSHDSGLGPGVYGPGDEPVYPFHPNCYDEKTEVYTDRGWTQFQNLQGDELILSINPENDVIEWVPYVAKVAYPYKGQMVHFKSISFDLLVTPNHRMYIKTNVHRGKRRWEKPHIEPAEEAILRGEFGVPRVGAWEGENPKYVMVGCLEIEIELYCKLIGYFLSEGCAHKRSDSGRIQATISQGKQGMGKIVNDLEQLPVKQWKGKTHLYLRNTDLEKYLFQFGKSYEKYIPNEIKQLSPRLIRIFLDAYRFGDGYERTIVRKKLDLKSVERLYFTSSKRMAEDIGELILKVGNYPSFKLQENKGKKFKHKNGTYTSNVDVWIISENTTKTAYYSRSVAYGLKFEKINYDGWVYDVQLKKNHILWVRRNGKTCWSGNCLCIAIPVHEQPEEFVERLKKWKNDPNSDKGLEDWYNEHGKYLAEGKWGKKPPTEDLSQAKTLDDCTRWAKTKYPHIKFEFDGAHLDTIKPTLQQFDRLASEWPDVVSNIKYFGTNRSFSAGTYAHVTLSGDAIGLNPAYYGNPRKFLQCVKQDTKTRWHPRGCDVVESVATHEFGHLVHFWLKKQSNKAILPAVGADGVGLVGATVDNWASHWVSNRRQAVIGLSRYAATDDMEAFAEAFAAYYYQEGRRGRFLQSFEALLQQVDKKKWLSDYEWLGSVGRDRRADAVKEIRNLKERLGML